MLMYRAQFFMFVLLVVDIQREISVFKDILTPEYVDVQPNIVNREDAKALLPIIRASRVSMMAIAGVMLLLSFKWLHVSKAYIFYMSLMHFIFAFFPIDREANSARTEVLLLSCIEFMLCYFNWLTGTVVSVLNIAWHSLGRKVIFEEPLTSESVFDMAILVVFCWLFHLVLSQFGKYYV